MVVEECCSGVVEDSVVVLLGELLFCMIEGVGVEGGEDDVVRCLCFLSALPFCCGVIGYEVWCMVPLVWKKAVKDVLMNSVPLSLLKVLMVD
ncbi:hypothetical protein Tco_0570363 [Tanacetum coccineum]